MTQHALTSSALENEASRESADQFRDLLGVLRRGWVLIACSVVICLTVAAIHLARTKRVYQASARLLIVQPTARPLKVSDNDPMRGLGVNTDDPVPTHMMIIRSPSVVEPALNEVTFVDRGRRDAKGDPVLDKLDLKKDTPSLANSADPAQDVISRLTVSRPDRGAKVLRVEYLADTPREAKLTLEAVIKSYEDFLRKNYQKNNDKIIELIGNASGKLKDELDDLQEKYAEARKSSSGLVDGAGRAFIAQRLDQWNRASNDAMLKIVQLKSQLELGRKLTSDGADPAKVVTAMNQLGGGLTLDSPPPEGSRSPSSYEQIVAELDEVRARRATAERLLGHLKDEHAADPEQGADNPEVLEAFWDDPRVTELQQELRRVERRRAAAKRLARGNDPSLASIERQSQMLGEEIRALWFRLRPTLLRQVSKDSNNTIGQAKTDLLTLKAREKTLQELLTQAETDRLRQLTAAERDLVARHGEGHPSVAEVRARIARVEGRKLETQSTEVGGRSGSLLDVIEQSLKSFEAMRREYESRFKQDMAVAEEIEAKRLTETNLRSELERQSTLYYTVVDQLKQATLGSDFNSVSSLALDPPKEPFSPIYPRRTTTMLMAFVVGCLLGMGVALTMDWLDQRIHTIAEVRDILKLRVLGVIPEIPVDHEDAPIAGLISHLRPRSLWAEAYKAARTNIEFIRRTQAAQVVLLTSPHPGDGKSTTASNIAISMAQAGRKTLLIDGDLRKPSLHKVHGAARSPGVVHVLKGLLPFDQAVQRTATENLDFVPAGPVIDNPADLLSQPCLPRLLEELRSQYDLILIDSSPLLIVTDSAIIGSVVDGIILVMNPTALHQGEAARVREWVKVMSTPILGMLFNKINYKRNGANSGYGYGYGYGYGREYKAYGNEPVLPIGVSGEAAAADGSNGVAGAAHAR